MSHDIILKNGLVVTPTGVIQGGVAIAGERIVAVGADATLGQAKRDIDVGGKIIFPGLFDPHVHFGVADKVGDDAMTEDFLHDTKDCLIGGVTTIATTTLIGRDPLLDLFERALRCGTGHSWCDFKITCVVNTLDQVQAIPATAKKGGVSYKFFTGYAGPQAEDFGMNREGITPAFSIRPASNFPAAGRLPSPRSTPKTRTCAASWLTDCGRWAGPISSRPGRNPARSGRRAYRSTPTGSSLISSACPSTPFTSAPLTRSIP
jgi:hypothetical protein